MHNISVNVLPCFAHFCVCLPIWKEHLLLGLLSQKTEKVLVILLALLIVCGALIIPPDKPELDFYSG